MRRYTMQGMMLSRTKRRWKAAADAAVAQPALLLEADRLAAEIARQVWRLHGGAPWAEASTESGVLMLQELALRMLAPEIVTASAALRHLSVLEQAVVSSDYEDVPAVREELAWVSELLAPTLTEGALGESVAGHETSAAARHERLRRELAVTLGKPLKLAMDAA